MAKSIVQYSGFFDSIGATPSDAGDIREYPAQEFSIHVKELFTDGVKRDQLQVVPSDTPYTVGVELGFACIQGRYYSMVLEGVSDGDDPQYLPLEFEAAETLTRVDRVVLRLDDSATLLGRWIRPMILAGTEGSDEPPALTRNDTVYEISLAQIKVRPGANAIAAEDITDERADASVCGWCKPYGATTPGMISAENVETGLLRQRAGLPRGPGGEQGGQVRQCYGEPARLRLERGERAVYASRAGRGHHRRDQRAAGLCPRRGRGHREGPRPRLEPHRLL